MQKVPQKLYTAAQVKEIERIAIDDHAVLGIDLMCKAGLAVFELIQTHYTNRELVVFCGIGNNAGDGYVVARLALNAGLKHTVYSLAQADQLKGDALIAYQNYIQAGGVVFPFEQTIVLKACLIVDALLGTGLNRKLSGDYAIAVELINQVSNPVVSVDIPTGLNADTGDLMGCAVKADYTVSFIGLKQGLFTGFAAEYRGEIVHSSLGLADELIQQVRHSSILVNDSHYPKRHRCAHKGNNGHLLVVGGDYGYAGAIRLAAEAALRVGAGLVSVATRSVHCSFINNGRPELMCHGIEDSAGLIALLDKANVVLIGPGLGQGAWGKDLFKLVVNTAKPLVIDADGLNLLAKQTIYQNQWILTPHPGEAARLLNCTTTEIAKDRFAAVSKLQKKLGGVVVLKGAGTLVDNGEKITVSTTGNPGMASGGMGDVLAGIIAGLLAQNMDLSEAASSAVYLHGKAADLSAEKNGEIGLLASDLMPFIRQLINQ